MCAECVVLSSPGSLEVILDRRLTQDDWRGLGEGLIDNVPVSSEFVLLFETFVSRPTVYVSISTLFVSPSGIISPLFFS